MHCRHRNHQVEGVLVAFFNEDFFNNLIIPSTFDERGCSYIAEKNGDILFHTDNCVNEEHFSSVIRDLSDGWTLNGANGQKLRGDIAAGGSDTIEVYQAKNGIYISYTPIGFHNWYLVSLTDAAVAEAQSKNIYEEIIPAFIYILLIIMAVAFYVIYIETKATNGSNERCTSKPSTMKATA